MSTQHRPPRPRRRNAARVLLGGVIAAPTLWIAGGPAAPHSTACGGGSGGGGSLFLGYGFGGGFVGGGLFLPLQGGDGGHIEFNIPTWHSVTVSVSGTPPTPPPAPPHDITVDLEIDFDQGDDFQSTQILALQAENGITIEADASILVPVGEAPRVGVATLTATCTFTPSGQQLTKTSKHNICIVEAAPDNPSIPRLAVSTLQNPPFQAVHAGSQSNHLLEITNNDPTETWRGSVVVQSTSLSGQPTFAKDPSAGKTVAGSVSDPFGDAFAIGINEVCLELPDPPHLSINQEGELDDLEIGPGETEIVSISMRPWPLCQSGSGCKGALIADGFFFAKGEVMSDDRGLACFDGVITYVDNEQAEPQPKGGEIRELLLAEPVGPDALAFSDDYGLLTCQPTPICGVQAGDVSVQVAGQQAPAEWGMIQQDVDARIGRLIASATSIQGPIPADAPIAFSAEIGLTSPNGQTPMFAGLTSPVGAPLGFAETAPFAKGVLSVDADADGEPDELLESIHQVTVEAVMQGGDVRRMRFDAGAVFQIAPTGDGLLIQAQGVLEGDGPAEPIEALHVAIDTRKALTIQTTPPPCPGDVDGDHSADSADLNLVLAQFGQCGYRPADLNGDAQVDSQDLNIQLASFGDACDPPLAYNRALGGVVLESGSQPGLWNVVTDVLLQTGPTAQPRDLSGLVSVALDAQPQGQLQLTGVAGPTAGGGPGAAPPCGGGFCAAWDLGGPAPIPGASTEAAGACVCQAALTRQAAADIDLNANQLTVTIEPSPGALQEIDDADDDVVIQLATATGTCCFRDKLCVEGVTAAECQNMQGFRFRFDQACFPGACDPGPLVGVCCVEGQCLDNVGSGECLVLAGVFTPGAVCGDVNCPAPGLGACCIDAECLGALSAPACAALGGEWTPGATCDDAACGAFTGDCCAPNGTPGCDDPTCTEAVCSAAPLCCELVWDEVCAGLAGVAAGCDCVSGCGPRAGDCCTPNGSPGCDEPECCELVCTADSFCCTIEWDQICADAAVDGCPELCGDPPTPCGPGEGDCCVANGTPGCSDLACCQLICGTDPFCCDNEWDQVCADAAKEQCDCPSQEPVAFSVVSLEASDAPGVNGANITTNGVIYQDQVFGGDDPPTEAFINLIGDALEFDSYIALDGENLNGEASPSTPAYTSNAASTALPTVFGPNFLEINAAFSNPGVGITSRFREDLGAEVVFFTRLTVEGAGSVNAPSVVVAVSDGGGGSVLLDLTTGVENAVPGPGGGKYYILVDQSDSAFGAVNDLYVATGAGVPPPPPDCGEPGSGDCCVPNGTPGCDDRACCEAVCAQASFCCDIEWDAQCAKAASVECGSCQAGACCFGDIDCVPSSGADECAGFGGEFQGPGTTCNDPDVCGGPAGGDCCQPNGTPGCDDPLCEAIVCNQDAFCCDIEWDRICADQANRACPVCQ